MSVFKHLPLGQRVPDLPHAVSCSLPTMRDLIGYETKDPETMRKLASGYPRFLMHPLVRQLANHLVSKHSLAGHTLWLTVSARAADELAAHIGAAHAVRFSADGLQGVAHPENPDLFARCKLFLQHTGMLLPSRAAEDHLVRLGVFDAAAGEEIVLGDASAKIKAVLRKAYAAATDDDMFFTPTGMNANYATFRAVNEVQSAEGRTIWVQLGWLYLDTICILKKFTANPAADHVVVDNIFDLSSLAQIFAEKGDRIAGIITEAPTNPLIQTADLGAVAELARKHGALFIADPSVASPFNIDVLRHADVVVNSLTKYAGNEGDIILGLAVVNPAGPKASLLRSSIARYVEPVWSRDLARLAAQIDGAEDYTAKAAATAIRVAKFLEDHPKVSEVFWPLHPNSRDNYLKLARSPGHVGSMLSFTLRGPITPFYDALRIAKGPSFGMKTSLLCPFVILAHYDLTQTDPGRAELARAGLSPELLRLAIGAEPAEDIIAALSEALDACHG